MTSAALFLVSLFPAESSSVASDLLDDLGSLLHTHHATFPSHYWDPPDACKEVLNNFADAAGSDQSDN